MGGGAEELKQQGCRVISVTAAMLLGQRQVVVPHAVPASPPRQLLALPDQYGHHAVGAKSIAAEKDNRHRTTCNHANETTPTCLAARCAQASHLGVFRVVTEVVKNGACRIQVQADGVEAVGHLPCDTAFKVSGGGKARRVLGPQHERCGVRKAHWCPNTPNTIVLAGCHAHVRWFSRAVQCWAAGRTFRKWWRRW